MQLTSELTSNAALIDALEKNKKPKIEASLLIVRLEGSEKGVIGSLLLDGLPFCYTLERPWQNNAHDISCIPSGSYRWTLENHAKFGLTISVCQVSGRAGILFHSGNTISDTHGCILLGRSVLFTSDGNYFLNCSRMAKYALIKTLVQTNATSGILVVR